MWNVQGMEHYPMLVRSELINKSKDEAYKYTVDWQKKIRKSKRNCKYVTILFDFMFFKKVGHV